MSESYSKPWRRRDFLRTSAQTATAITLASAMPQRVLHALGVYSPYARMTGAESSQYLADPALMQRLVLQAVDAARSAGARYAEARVTRTVSQIFVGSQVQSDSEHLAIGVRVLVGGAWGFAASSYWELEEASTLARDAVEQARINASVFPRDVELGTYPVAKGSWVTPVRIDPFSIPIEQKSDFCRSFDGLLPRHVRGWKYGAEVDKLVFTRQERMVATSENALFSQTRYETEGSFALWAAAQGRNVIVRGHGLAAAGAGWELLLEAKLHEQIPGLIEEAEAKHARPPAKPVDVGRYEVVMPASVMASFVGSTLGNATQLDRAVGMEANAGGTSYLGPDPVDHLGTTLGSPLLAVSANRSQPKGLATIKWDDEGVEPETFSLIENGVFVDYQTTREQASWLEPWYQSRQHPMRSHGCAVAPSATDFPLQHTPNLQMKPGSGTTTFEDMIKNTSKGIAFMSGGASTDFQSRTGQANGEMREIVNGKIGPVLEGAQIIFDSTQLWKNLTELGGEASADVVAAGSIKGQPVQASSYSVNTVAGRFKELTVVDAKRK